MRGVRSRDLGFVLHCQRGGHVYIAGGRVVDGVVAIIGVRRSGESIPTSRYEPSMSGGERAVPIDAWAQSHGWAPLVKAANEET
jgi:hypothetical protein